MSNYENGLKFIAFKLMIAFSITFLVLKVKEIIYQSNFRDKCADFLRKVWFVCSIIFFIGEFFPTLRDSVDIIFNIVDLAKDIVENILNAMD